MGRLPRADERARSITETGAACPACEDLNDWDARVCACGALLYPYDAVRDRESRLRENLTNRAA